MKTKEKKSFVFIIYLTLKKRNSTKTHLSFFESCMIFTGVYIYTALHQFLNKKL